MQGSRHLGDRGGATLQPFSGEKIFFLRKIGVEEKRDKK